MERIPLSSGAAHVLVQNHPVYVSDGVFSDRFPFEDDTFQVIYCDPPWIQDSQLGREKKRGNPELYPLLSTRDLCDLPVADITAKDATVFMWALDAMIPDAIELMRAWGFLYKTVAFTWYKQTSRGNDHFGTGAWTRKGTELCLMGVKGRPKRVSASVRQLQRGSVREHSRKPDIVRERIVELMGDVPRLEMFCRYPEQGWYSWGNEVSM